MTLREYLNKQQAEVYNNIIQNKLIEKENEKYKNIKIIKTSKKKINKKNTASTTPIQKINTILHNTENIEELDTKLPPVAEIEQSITNTIIPQNLNDISLFYSNNYSAIELKVFAKFHNYYIARKPYCKTESCPICFEDECEIIPYDCFCHGYCITCSLKIDKCSMCKINKNPDFKHLI